MQVINVSLKYLRLDFLAIRESTRLPFPRIILAENPILPIPSCHWTKCIPPNSVFFIALREL
jgi:hypothetical protein